MKKIVQVVALCKKKKKRGDLIYVFKVPGRLGWWPLTRHGGKKYVSNKMMKKSCCLSLTGSMVYHLKPKHNEFDFPAH